MNGLIEKLRSRPATARVAPFFIFVALTACQGLFGEASRYWMYVAKSLVGIWLIWAIRPVVPEIRWTISLEAILVGILVIVVWIGLDRSYGKLTDVTKHWNPHEQFGRGSALAWFFIVSRIVFSSLVVPPIEEMFYRSFLYRYIIKPDFEQVSLKTFHLVSFLVTSTVFGFMHREWLAGILCGLAYQWLVIRKGHLGDAMTAHAISNLLLGLWVVYKEAWVFW
jgi:CAAX prenyl protease-like protein